MPISDVSGAVARIELPRRDLAMMLEGFDAKNVVKRRRYSHTSA